MHIQVFSSSLSQYSTIIILSLLITFSLSQAQDAEPFWECRNHTYSCGQNIQEVGYPFWGEGRPSFCGRPEFELKCHENDYATIDIDEHSFRVVSINQLMYTMTMARLDLWDTHCNTTLRNITLNDNLFVNAPNVQDLYIFYNCNSNSNVSRPANFSREFGNNFTCYMDGVGEMNGFYVDGSFLRVEIEDPELSSCAVGIEVKVLKTSLDRLRNGSVELQEALERGFEVLYNASSARCLTCNASGGICGSNSSSRQFVCLCPDQPYSHDQFCRNHGTSLTMPFKFAIGASAAGMMILLTCIIICITRSKTLSCESITFWKKKTNADRNIEAFIRQYGTLAIKRYSYSDVKKMTNLFKDKLGQGGYGGVYKGKLHDGHPVAVKILNASKGNGEEFINEVASISKTSHVNVVTLLGFCFENRKRALIYELMPNGSLEKFIYSKDTLNTSGHLGWEKLHEIAIGTARGLEYLHRGCNTRILHFDIKPHNILLDEDFCPKISDFGLAKLCTRKENIISMLGARGTIGYIAPEVFCRNFGGVSHKSDVYSYGMMVLEMVGVKNNIDIEVDHTSEIYFPHWIHKRLELNEDLQLSANMTKEENQIARKMVFVGLWCIQTDPSQRPPMNKVLEMLEGSIGTLEIPPKPYLSSPPRSIIDSSTTSIMV